MKNFFKRIFGIDVREDWQKKIDDDLALEQKTKETYINKFNSDQHARDLTVGLAIKQTREQQLLDHKAKFKCHICGISSRGPAIIPGSPSGWGYGGTSDKEDFNTPTGLGTCYKCGKLACEKHLYKGVCKTCTVNS